ncbi:hypothetical protein P692DRAFT_20882259 [Suillus brevipes Sb2]|nr:hypothetical protein P692DRAFT_20882259 [Suillus brevipes Sb2]
MDIGPRPSAKPLSDTKCLDTIRRLKRIRRILRRTRLVSVAPEADTQEVHQEQSFEKDAPRQQHDTSPSTNIEDVIARAVEATMRRILSEKDFLLTKKCSPQKKKIEDKEIQREKAAELSCERDFLLGEVRCLFKDVFNIAQDADFIIHEPVVREEVYSYEYEDDPGPDLKNLTFDLRNGSKTPWNSQRRISLRMIWMATQPKVTVKGILETPVEVEKRLVTKKDETLKATRRRNKYRRRVAVVDHLVKQTSDENEEDLPAWQWLQRLIKTLGEGGMSSEESDVENDIETVLRVKNMIWRRAIEWEMDIVDHQRLVDDDIFAPQGSKPMKCICAGGNLTTSRAQVNGLPKVLYSEGWLAGLTKRQVERLMISEEEFKWMKVAVA